MVVSLGKRLGTEWPFVTVSVHRTAGFWSLRPLRTAVRFGGTSYAPSKIRWRAGKGVIGRSYRHSTFEVVDLRSAAYKAVTSKADWRALPADERLGMSFEEWQQTKRDAYEVVAAHPILDAGRVIGVVSLHGTQKAMGRLEATDVEKFLGEAATSIVEDLPILWRFVLPRLTPRRTVLSRRRS